MMKEYFPFVIGALLIVVLGVFFLLPKEDKEVPLQNKNGVQKEVPAEENKSGEGIVSSIRDAMGMGKQMKCTYTAGDGENAFSSTVSVLGEKFTSETVVANMTLRALFDGDTQYTWNEVTKQGFKMSKACLDSLNDKLSQSTSETLTKPEDYTAEFDSAQNVKCESTTDVDFTLPLDITFTDQCAMMQESLKMMEQINR